MACSMNAKKAGPLPERAVTASKHFSGSTTVRPAPLRIFATRFTSAGVAFFAGQIAHIAERCERLAGGDGDDERLLREERLYVRRERGEVLRTHSEEDHVRGARDVLCVRRGAHVVAFREFLRACGNLLRHQDGLRVEALLARGGREDALGHLTGAEKSK